MEQLIFHLVGDYLTQTHWMAKNKVRSSVVATIHALVYSLPFLLIGSVWAWGVIFTTHALIDRYSLAKYVIWFKNRCTPGGVTWWEARHNFGYPTEMPAWMAFWLYVAADNTMHLIINYTALRWL